MLCIFSEREASSHGEIKRFFEGAVGQMKRIFLLGFIFVALIFSSCSRTIPGARRGDVPHTMFIERDVTWKGEILVDGLVVVRKGATLTIEPGTRVVFTSRALNIGDEHEGFSRSGMKVEGRILALGTEDLPIVFTSADPKGPESWDRIYLSFSKGSKFRYCIFEYGSYALHAHFSVFSLERCIFRFNREGVRIGGSKAEIKDSVFTANAIRGINFKESENTITGCAVYGNGTGIFLHSKDSRSVIKRNAIYGNRRYNLRLGDLHTDDVDVSGNWWGTVDPEKIEEGIYDGHDQEGIGKAQIRPYSPFPEVTVSGIEGILTYKRKGVEGEVFAIRSLAGGFDDSISIARAFADEDGFFSLDLPPGSYFVYARSSGEREEFFGFTGNNPVRAKPFERETIGIPMVDVSSVERRDGCAGGGITGVRVVTKLDGKPVAGVHVFVYPSSTRDIRGPGVALGITKEDGSVLLSLKEGDYIVVARKKRSGPGVGRVDTGGLFGIYPYIPVRVDKGCLKTIDVPLFVKGGMLDEEETRDKSGLESGGGYAYFAGRPAAGWFVYFYSGRRALGKPVSVSSSIAGNGYFEVAGELEDGLYYVYLRKSAEAGEMGARKIVAGPLVVKVRDGRLNPEVLKFK